MLTGNRKSSDGKSNSSYDGVKGSGAVTTSFV